MRSSKKILFNLNTFPVSGNIIPLVERIRFWQKKNYTLIVFSSRALKEKIDSLIKLGENHQFIELENCREVTSKLAFITESLKRNIRSLRYLRELKMRIDGGIIFSISTVLDLVFIPYIIKSRKKSTKWVVVFDNTVPFTGSGNKLIRFMNWSFFQISSCLIKKADRIFVSSENVIPFLKRRRFEPERILSTGNGVEADLIRKAKVDPEYKIDALFIGRINEAKGIYEMLKVLELVVKDIPSFQLAIMGSGDDTTVAKYREQINKMKLARNVQFLGYKNGQEKFNIIKSSKCFWFFSESEGFPVSLMEAVSSGLQCFVYYLPAYDYYKNSELMIFKQKDSTAVAKAVIDLFKKKDFENKAGSALLDVFSWARIAEMEFESTL